MQVWPDSSSIKRMHPWILWLAQPMSHQLQGHHHNYNSYFPSHQLDQSLEACTNRASKGCQKSVMCAHHRYLWWLDRDYWPAERWKLPLSSPQSLKPTFAQKRSFSPSTAFLKRQTLSWVTDGPGSASFWVLWVEISAILWKMLDPLLLIMRFVKDTLAKNTLTTPWLKNTLCTPWFALWWTPWEQWQNAFGHILPKLNEVWAFIWKAPGPTTR